MLLLLLLLLLLLRGFIWTVVTIFGICRRLNLIFNHYLLRPNRTLTARIIPRCSRPEQDGGFLTRRLVHDRWGTLTVDRKLNHVPLREEFLEPQNELLVPREEGRDTVNYTGDIVV